MLLRMFGKRLTTYRANGYARGEAPLGFAEPPAVQTIEYDEEAIRHFEDNWRQRKEQTQRSGDNL